MSYNQGESGVHNGGPVGRENLANFGGSYGSPSPGRWTRVFGANFAPPPPPLFVYRGVANLISEWHRLECKTNMTT